MSDTFKDSVKRVNLLSKALETLADSTLTIAITDKARLASDLRLVLTAANLAAEYRRLAEQRGSVIVFGDEVADLDALADRFLKWPVPTGCAADPCATDGHYMYARSGTNFLGHRHAKDMLAFVLTKEKNNA